MRGSWITFVIVALAGNALANEYLRPQDLMRYYGDQGKVLPVKTATDWERRRSHLLKGMEQVMGELPSPEKREALAVETLEATETEKYTRKKITFVSEPGDRVPAYLLIPHGLEKPAAAMLCLHQTTPGGKQSPAGLSDRPTLHYAHELAERGFVCIVPDYPSFGDYKYDFAADRYESGTMKGIWNHIRAVDLLESLPEVDRKRIGVIGHSLGGHNALFVAAFDERIAAVVTSCGFTGFKHYYGGNLQGWASDRYMPRIASKYDNLPRLPFDFHGVLGAIAPRAIFVCAPLHDDNFSVEGVREVETEVKKVYKLLGAEEKLVFEYPDEKHEFPDAVRKRSYEWLEKVLK